MAKPEWCDYCARDQKCANEDYQGNGSCAERIALWDEAFAAGAALLGDARELARLVTHLVGVKSVFDAMHAYAPGTLSQLCMRCDRVAAAVEAAPDTGSEKGGAHG